jgi:hypothetical protein
MEILYGRTRRFTAQNGAFRGEQRYDRERRGRPALLGVSRGGRRATAAAIWGFPSRVLDLGMRVDALPSLCSTLWCQKL